MLSSTNLPAPVVRALLRYQDSLRSRFGERLKEFVLFGSFARGEAHEESDVDVLVVIADLMESERNEVLDLAHDADAVERESWVGLSPLAYSETQAHELRSREKLLFKDVDSQGIRL